MSGTLISSVGCGAGSTVEIAGNAAILVAPVGGDCPDPDAGPVSYATSRVLTCTGAVCTAVGSGKDGDATTTWTRISTTAIAFRVEPPDPRCPQIGSENSTAQLSADGRTLTNRGWACWYWTSNSGAPAGATLVVTFRMTR